MFIYGSRYYLIIDNKIIKMKETILKIKLIFIKLYRLNIYTIITLIDFITNEH